MGSPQSNWFSWLGAQLEQVGVPCLAPQFPTPEGQELGAWLRVIKKTCGKLGKTDILIGHSIGAAFVLRVLERLTQPIFCAALIAPFARPLGLPEYDPLNATFVTAPFDWGRIRGAAAHFRIYSGADDPYVPLAHGIETAGALGAKLTVVPKGGHLNAESGFTAFQLLFDDLRGVVFGEAL
jgi:predicted alpha/beta hydrolase family esterase